MNFDEWKLMNDRAVSVIDEYAAAGICVPATRRGTEALTTLQRVDYLQSRARATDAAREKSRLRPYLGDRRYPDEVRPVRLLGDDSWAEEDARLQARRAKAQAVVDSYQRHGYKPMASTAAKPKLARRRRVVCDIEPVRPVTHRRIPGTDAAVGPLAYYQQRAAECLRLA